MPHPILRPRTPNPVPLVDIARHLGAEIVGDPEGTAVSGVASGTGSEHAGDLFVGVPGVRAHGASYADKAVAAGAVALLTDAAGAELAAGAGVPIVVTDDPRAAIARAGEAVYGTSSTPTVLFAVTGTNGKTTTTYLLAEVFEALGFRTGLSGTVERVVADERVETRDSGRLTTPESDMLHGLVARMREDAVEAAAIEVSSHGIDGGRIDGLPFDVSIFTNFSQDHLDEYGTMDRYFAAKMGLFTPERTRRGLVVIDDEWGRRAVDDAQVPMTTISSHAESGADWHFTVLEGDLERTRFRLAHRDGAVIETSLEMPGWFTALDAALAIVAVLDSQLDVDVERMARALQDAGGLRPTVPGRLDLASGDAGVRVYVDYGHTEASFRAVLGVLRQFTDGKLIMVFGADGDRDATKRPAMARAASEDTDAVIVTDYNPRTEVPAAIRRTLVETINREFPHREVHEIADSADGIRKAVSIADAGDIIFVGGHGHRRDVEVGGELVPYSVKDAVREALEAEGWGVGD